MKPPTLKPCAVATCLFSTSSDLFPTRIFWTLSGAYCRGVAMGYAFNRGGIGKARKGRRPISNVEGIEGRGHGRGHGSGNANISRVNIKNRTQEEIRSIMTKLIQLKGETRRKQGRRRLHQHTHCSLNVRMRNGTP